MTVRFLQPARDEFLATVEYYEDQQQGLGTRFIDEVDVVIDILESTPSAGTPFTEGTRRLVVRHFPYNYRLHRQPRPTHRRCRPSAPSTRLLERASLIASPFNHGGWGVDSHPDRLVDRDRFYTRLHLTENVRLGG